jgi:hypothetical protein
MRLFTPITKKTETLEAPNIRSVNWKIKCCSFGPLLQEIPLNTHRNKKEVVYVYKKRNRVGKVSLQLAKINCLIIPNLCSLESKYLSRYILRRLKMPEGISSMCHFLQACDLSSKAYKKITPLGHAHKNISVWLCSPPTACDMAEKGPGWTAMHHTYSSSLITGFWTAFSYASLSHWSRGGDYNT